MFQFNMLFIDETVDVDSEHAVRKRTPLSRISSHPVAGLVKLVQDSRGQSEHGRAAMQRVFLTNTKANADQERVLRWC